MMQRKRPFGDAGTYWMTPEGWDQRNKRVQTRHGAHTVMELELFNDNHVPSDLSSMPSYYVDEEVLNEHTNVVEGSHNPKARDFANGLNRLGEIGPVERPLYVVDSQIPWNPLQAFGCGQVDRIANSSRGGLQPHYPTFSGGTTTDTITLGRPRSDSGYGTQANQSPIVQLGEPADGHRNMTNMAFETVQDLMNCSQFDGDQLANAREMPDFANYLQRSAPNLELPGPLALNAPSNPPYRCQRCDSDPGAKKEEYKNKSDWKKHVLRHEKPWKCGVPNCKRQQEGFSTKNDLDRHKKSVHSVLPDGLTNDKTYICAATKCAKKNKIWPRADNFKQHCDRVHKKEGYDVVELMNKSFVPSGDARLRSGGGSTTSSLPGDSGLLPYPSILSACQSEYDPLFNTYAQSGKSRESGRPGIITPILNTREYFDDVNYQYPSRGPSKELPSRAKGSFRHKDEDLSSHQKESSSLGEPRHSLPCDPQDPVNHGIRPRNPRSYKGSHRKAVVHNTLTERRLRQTRSSEADEPGEMQPNPMISNLSQGPFDIAGKSLEVQDAEPMDDGHQDAKDLEANLHQRTGPMLREPSDRTTSRVHNDPPMENFTTPRSSDSKKNEFKCKQCEKVKDSASKLKKHEKRHAKPYGCTFPLCNKLFGSKNDWKRHENTMHFQGECWRCGESRTRFEGELDREVGEPFPTRTGAVGQCSLISPEHKRQPSANLGQQQPCTLVFYDKSEFCGHLETEHGIASRGERRKKCSKSRIGAAGQDSFWCGFCERIIPLKAHGIKAWDERFDHVDNDHFKIGMDIQEWRDMDGTMKGGKEVEEKFSARRTEVCLSSAAEDFDDPSRTVQREFSPDTRDPSISSDEGDANSQVEIVDPIPNFGLRGHHVGSHTSQDHSSVCATTTKPYLIGIGPGDDGAIIGNIQPNEGVLADATLPTHDETDLVSFSRQVPAGTRGERVSIDTDTYGNDMIPANDWENEQPQVPSRCDSPALSNSSQDSSSSTSSNSVTSSARSSPPSPDLVWGSEATFTQGTGIPAARQDSSAANVTSQLQCLEATNCNENTKVLDANSIGALDECERNIHENNNMQISNGHDINVGSTSIDPKAPSNATNSAQSRHKGKSVIVTMENTRSKRASATNSIAIISNVSGVGNFR